MMVILIFLLACAVSAQDLEGISNAKPVALQGSVGFKTSLYGADGASNRQDPLAYGVDANATLDFYGVSMPFSLTWYDRNVSYSHPFAQFGLSPKYKWMTGHFGYRSVAFSEFTLNGRTFLGAGLELTPGNWRLGGLYGKFNNEADYNPVTASEIRPLSRTGWAVKTGYGAQRGFLDVTMLRIGDDDANYKPSTDPDVPTPEQNVAAGVHGKINIRDDVVLESEGAVSVVTGDTKAQKLEGDAPAWLSFGNAFIDINESSEYATALKANLKWKINRALVSGLEYRRIEPGYRSLGAYYFANDLENININQTVIFYRNKVNVRGSLGFQHDNLADTKATTTTRTIGSVNTSYQINTKFGLDAGYSNFSTSQKAGTTPLIDSLKLDQVNSNITVAPRFATADQRHSHSVVLMGNFMVLSDGNKATRKTTETNTSTYSLNYTVGFVPEKAAVTASLSRTALNNAFYKSTLSGVSAGVNKTLASDRLNLGWNNSFMVNRVNNDDGTVFTTSATAGYRLLEHNNINLNVYFTRCGFEKGSVSPSTKEYRGDLNYVYSF